LLADEFDVGQLQTGPQAAVASLFGTTARIRRCRHPEQIDALDENALLAAETRIRECAPNVRFLELAYQAKLDIRLALGLRLHQPALSAHSHFTPLATMPGNNASVLGNHRLLDGHAHSGLASHSHGLATHKHFHEQDPGWLSFVLRSQDPQQPEVLKTALAKSPRPVPYCASRASS